VQQLVSIELIATAETALPATVSSTLYFETTVAVVKVHNYNMIDAAVTRLCASGTA
jgi:hypothetical protein